MWISKENFDKACANFDKQVAKIDKQERLITSLLYYLNLKVWDDSNMLFPRMVTTDEYESLMDELNKQGAYKHRNW